MTVVAELVRIPLAVPFEAFLGIFTSQLEPVLLAQPGIISILTGKVIPPVKDKENFAVSLTQWETMEAHGAFLASDVAKPFFETLQLLTRGPPTIEHYNMAKLDASSLRLRYGHFSILGGGNRQAQNGNLSQHLETHGDMVGFTGDCVEVDGQSVLVSLSNGEDFGVLISHEPSKRLADTFRVEWTRSSVANKHSPNL